MGCAMKKLGHIRFSTGAALALPLLLMVAACNNDDEVASAPGTEDAQTAGPVFGGEVDSSPEAIEAAKKQAVEIAGGQGSMRSAPEPRQGEIAQGSVLNEAMANMNTGETQADCASVAEFGNEWATRLPQTFPIYPGASVTEAAGTDSGGCKLRVVNFVTAVPLNDVMDFYYTVAANNGYSTQRVMSGGEDTLGGSMAGSYFTVVGRERAGGGADFDLMVSGG